MIDGRTIVALTVGLVAGWWLANKANRKATQPQLTNQQLISALLTQPAIR